MVHSFIDDFTGMPRMQMVIAFQKCRKYGGWRTTFGSCLRTIL
jgi:hypothetical protein